MRGIIIFLSCAAGLFGAEVRTLTLREAVALALKQNPDVLLARLEEQKAESAVKLAKDPFIPKVVVGSGLAYSNGFPMSIEGATPSIVQARGVGFVFNRPQNFRIAAAKEGRRGAALDTASKQEEAVYRTVDVFLEAQKSARMAAAAANEAKALEGVLETLRARAAEGRELPIEVRKAEVNLARARYRVQSLEASTRAAQRALAFALGMELEDRVQPSDDEMPVLPLPDSEEAAVTSALANSKELRLLQSRILAKGYDVRAERAGRLPKLDLVAQYGLLARFNNYEDFFRKFQRHNWQMGISFQAPLFNGLGVSAATSQAEAEAAQLRVQFRNARSRVDADTRKAYEDIRQATAARDLAKLDLDVAREQVSLLLAQMDEGRAGLRQVEEARADETGKWIVLYDAGANLDKAKMALLRQTGDLVAALR